MAKLKNPLLALSAFGQVSAQLVARRRANSTVLEAKPYPKDAKTSSQLTWRTMYQLAVSLWHALSPGEKDTWESNARPHHMTGFAWFMSQALRPNPGIYLPLAGGTMTGNIDMAAHKLTNLPAPIADDEPARKADLATYARIAGGNYDGDNTDNRAIPHTLGRRPVLVYLTDDDFLVFALLTPMYGYIHSFLPLPTTVYELTPMDDVNFYVGHSDNYAKSANDGYYYYYWIAIG